MSYPLPAARIAALLDAPVDNVQALWPHVETALRDLGIATELVCIAALATIRVEEPTFAPQCEKYNGTMDEYFKKYDGRFGNDAPGDGCKYRGRGPAQLTFKDNYARLGKEIGVDLVNQPELALDPVYAAQIFARFLRDKHVDLAANRQDWVKVRKLWNGGSNGLREFSIYVQRLQANAAVKPHVSSLAGAGPPV